jgi:predicted PurR-regulated permease PerM
MRRYLTFPWIFRAVAWGLFGILIILGLDYGQELLVPFVVGGLLAIAVLPIAEKLESWRIPRIVANIIIIGGGVLFLAAITYLFFFIIRDFTQEAPALKEQALTNVSAIMNTIESITGYPVDEQMLFLQEKIGGILFTLENAQTLVTQTTALSFGTMMVIVYMFFILYYRDKFKEALLSLTPASFVTQTHTALLGITRVMPKYLIGLFNLIIIVTIISSLGFWMIGLSNPLFFGLFTGFMNAIPYIGPLVAFIAVILFALTTHTVPVIIGTIIMFFVVQFLDNNILAPIVAASPIDINPLAAIIGILIGGYLWGITGMIIALPLLGIVKVLCDTIPAWKTFGFLLGTEGTEKHALTWANIRAFFIR